MVLTHGRLLGFVEWNYNLFKMKINYYLAILAIVSLFASCVKEPALGEGSVPSGENDGYADYGDDVVKGWVRIKLTEEAQPLYVGELTRGAARTGNSQLDEVATRLGATEIRRVFADGGKYAARRRRFGLHLWYDLKLGENVPVSRAEASVGSIPGVEHVQPIYKRKFIEEAIVPAEYVYVPATISARRPMAAADLPFNDPELSKQWHYNNDGSLEGSVAGADMNLFKGWETLGTHGSPQVIVAVIDSGIQWDHPDLADNIWFNEAELNGAKDVDDDNNGYYDDIYGACFMPNTFPHNKPGGVMAPGTHGTHVAGTIAAVNGNGEGVCGIAGGTGNKDGVKLMSIQITRDGYPGEDLPLDDVFAYAADNGAVIASCSWTISKEGMGKDTEAGIEYFNANAGMEDTDGDGINDIQVGPMAGGLCIFGTGNDGKNKVYYPARDPRVVGVGAILPDGQIAEYTDFGEGLDILAPGGGNNQGPRNLQVYSTSTNGGYAYSAGTSMATPHVSGVAALILSKFQGPGFTAAELRSRLESSCRPLGVEIDQKYHGNIGYGLLDASLALTERPEEGPQTPRFTAAPTAASVTFTGPVPVDGNGMPVAEYNLEYTEVVNGTAGEVNKMVLTNLYTPQEQFRYRFEGNSESYYKFRINAIDRYGNESEYIDLESATLIFDNHAPVLLREFADVEIKKTGEDYQRLYTLLTYFEEVDAKYGDEMTFSVRNSDERVVATELRAGKTIIITPLAKGSCTVTARAEDTRGGVTEGVINVTVLDGPVAYIELLKPFGNVSLPYNGKFARDYDLTKYFACPVDADVTFTAVSSDPSAVSASVTQEGQLNVTALRKGSASVTVRADDGRGDAVEDILSVTVTEDAAPAAAGALSLYPNPVGDYLNVRLEGASSQSVGITFYDAASRRVFGTDAQLDADGTVRLEQVAKLSPGSYTVAVRYGSQTKTGTILKR